MLRHYMISLYNALDSNKNRVLIYYVVFFFAMYFIIKAIDYNNHEDNLKKYKKLKYFIWIFTAFNEIYIIAFYIINKIDIFYLTYLLITTVIYITFLFYLKYLYNERNFRKMFKIYSALILLINYMTLLNIMNIN